MRTLLLLALTTSAFGHDVITTKLLWTQEISRIVYRHCATCHRPDGVAMSLVTYTDARPWAKAIRDEVLSRRMPPWGAVKGVGEFKDDPSLSQIEIDMIVNWVEGGAPQGDEIYLPRAPHFDATAKPVAPPAREILVSSTAPRILNTDVAAAGIRPQHLANGASLEVTACRPDGGVEHLIWIRDWHATWQRTYSFRHPLRLTKGTRISVYSSQPAGAAIEIAE